MANVGAASTLASGVANHRGRNRGLLLPEKETTLWLGFPVTRHLSSTTPAAETGVQENRPMGDTYLAGTFRLCEILIRAYLENPTIPNLAFSLGVSELPSPGGLFMGTSMDGGGNNINIANFAAANVPPNGGTQGRGTSLGAALRTTSSQAAAAVGETGSAGMTLRQIIRDAMIHLSIGSWDFSACFIINVSSIIHIDSALFTNLPDVF